MELIVETLTQSVFLPVTEAVGLVKCLLQLCTVDLVDLMLVIWSERFYQEEALRGEDATKLMITREQSMSSCLGSSELIHTWI